MEPVVFTSESVSGTLQMFLVDDACNASAANCASELEGAADKSEKNEPLVLSVDNIDSPLTDQLNHAVAGGELSTSRRSLRLKSGKKTISYKTASDDESFSDFDIKNVLVQQPIKRPRGRPPKSAMSTTDKTPKKTKSSDIKPHACDECNLRCKTAANLKAHKQTHAVIKPFTCTHCAYTCKRRSDMKKHEETHGPKSMYPCVHCDYSGKRLKYLKKHMKIHSKNRETSFACHLCQYRCHNKSSLDNHLTTHSNLRPYQCAMCQESFKQKWALTKHMVIHSETTPFICDVCGAAFKRKDHLRKHSLRHLDGSKTRKASITKSESFENFFPESKEDFILTNIKIENPDDSVSSSKKLIDECLYSSYKKDPSGMFSCSTCDYSCSTRNSLRRHLRKHSDYKPFICQQCGASFKRKDHLKVHKFTHTDIRPHRCPHCSYGTHRKYRLTLHILTHQTIKPVSCSFCEYRCRRVCELKYHMKNKHSVYTVQDPELKEKVSSSGVEEILYKCDKCDFICDSLKRFKYHMRRHENKTPHTCPHCDYRCSSRSSLSDHLLQHAGIKPCLCSVCGMAFRNTSRLNRHKLVHSDFKPFACNFCEFSSRSKYNLKQHMLRHTDKGKIRRRVRKPTKPLEKAVLDSGATTEILKQSYQPDIHTLLTDMFRENNHQVAEQFMQSLDNSTLSGLQDRQPSGNKTDQLKPRDIPLQQHSPHIFSSLHQTANGNINPYHLDRPILPGVVNGPLSYHDLYHSSNAFLTQTALPFSTGISIGNPNPNFGYMDRNGGFDFTNSYFYNETVFPGNLNPTMYAASCTNSYSLSPISMKSACQNILDSNIQLPTKSQLIDLALQSFDENRNKKVVNNEFDGISLNKKVVINKYDGIPLNKKVINNELDGISLSEDVDRNIRETNSQAKLTDLSVDSGVSTTKSDSENLSKPTHCCPECGYICLTKTMLQRHQTTHIDIKPYKCEDCQKAFKRMDHMKAHKRTHTTSKPFTCDLCNYTCSRKYRLKLHEKTHTHEAEYPTVATGSNNDPDNGFDDSNDQSNRHSRFTCDKCNFKCDVKAELEIHVVSHKSFHCELCSYISRSSKEFSNHKRMHTEQAELVCSVCNYTCNSQKRLKYHMERHNNKTPLTCRHCNYRCSSRSSLTDHLLQHEGLKPFLCAECGMRFRNVSRLNRHKLTHTDLKPHACEFCPFSSRSRYNLKQHMSRHFK